MGQGLMALESLSVAYLFCESYRQAGLTTIIYKVPSGHRILLGHCLFKHDGRWVGGSRGNRWWVKARLSLKVRVWWWVSIARGNGWRGRVLGSRGSRGVTWLHTSARCPACHPHHDADQDYHSDEVLQHTFSNM